MSVGAAEFVIESLADLAAEERPLARAVADLPRSELERRSCCCYASTSARGPTTQLLLLRFNLSPRANYVVRALSLVPAAQLVAALHRAAVAIIASQMCDARDSPSVRPAVRERMLLPVLMGDIRLAGAPRWLRVQTWRLGWTPWYDVVPLLSRVRGGRRFRALSAPRPAGPPEESTCPPTPAVPPSGSAPASVSRRRHGRRRHPLRRRTLPHPWRRQPAVRAAVAEIRRPSAGHQGDGRRKAG